MKYKKVITVYSNDEIPQVKVPAKYRSKVELITKDDGQAIVSVIKHHNEGKKIIIFQRLEYVIGGIETWGYNLAKTFNDKDITFVFQQADREQVERLSKYANVIIDDGKMEYECDIFISANYDGNSEILDRVKSKKYYQTIHSDFNALKKLPNWRDFELEIDPKYQIIAASKTVQAGLEELGIHSAVATNPLASINDRPLVLLSMTRVTLEKGLSRMVKLANELRNKNIDFVWLIAATFDNTDQPELAKMLKEMPEIIAIKPSVRNEALYWLADYCVQLSDTEAYCYTIRSALQHKLPVIATRFPEAEKIIRDGENGYLLDFNMNNLDVVKLKENIPQIKEAYAEEVDKAWVEIFK